MTHFSGIEISLIKLLQMMGLEKKAPVKMYRHIDHVLSGVYPVDVEELHRSKELEPFQSFQGNHVLGEGYVAFFIGERNNLARFIGMWKVVNHGRGNAKSRMGSSEYFNYFTNDDYWYDLKHQIQFVSLVDRLVVKWSLGPGAHRWLVDRNGDKSDFPVYQIRATGLSKPFPGFGELQLTFDELCKLVKEGDGGNGWIEALRSTRGVYLISDCQTGDLYVGSATGVNGFFGRWQDYAGCIHGGNKNLIEALKSGKLEPSNLRYCILETISNLAGKKEGYAAEINWKSKLGRAAISLNAN